MSDSLLNKYTRPQTEPDDPQLETEDLGSFGWLRGMRERATMLELRKKDGNITAIGYAWIEKIEFDPSEGITIHALGRRVKIQGRNLNVEVRPGVGLFQTLTRHRLLWLRECDYVDPKETAIEKISDQ
jgi:hypothetical protein